MIIIISILLYIVFDIIIVIMDDDHDRNPSYIYTIHILIHDTFVCASNANKSHTREKKYYEIRFIGYGLYSVSKQHICFAVILILFERVV